MLKECKEKFFKKLTKNRNFSEKDLEFLDKVYSFAFKAHINQKRKSGDPFITHPAETALILSFWGLDVITIAAGLLHDVIEDTYITRENIEKEFGKELAYIVDSLTKTSNINTQNIDKYKSHKKLTYFRKLIIAVTEDIRVIFVKLADRLHNLRTIESLPKEKQKKIAMESLELYAPIAARLGLYVARREIEDLSFKILYPNEYNYIKQFVEKLDINKIHQIIEEIRNLLEKDGFKELRIKYRIKHLYSIYRKLKQKQKIDEIYDIIGIRIITKKVEECYSILGILHKNYTPIAGRFKDYISLPKSNNYQSLHTTLIINGKIVEIQIRTEEMDRIAEYGIAAHFLYKENRKEYDSVDRTFQNLREFLNTEYISSYNYFYKKLRQELFKDEIYVYTPKGDIIFLPSGATVLDFAFYIHTDLGLHTKGAFVNGKFVPIDYKLKNSDTIEIVKSSKEEVSLEWLDKVSTYKAKSKIKQYLKEKNKDLYIKEGYKKLLSVLKELEKEGEVNHISIEEILKNAKDKLGGNIDSQEDILIEIGMGKLSPWVVLRKVNIIQKTNKKRNNLTLKQEKNFIKLDNITNVPVKIAKCCFPIPGDKIGAIRSLTGELVIHKIDCKNYRRSRNKINTQWNIDSGNFKTRINFVAKDVPGLLKMISDNVAKLDSNIENIVYKVDNQGIGKGYMILRVKNLDHLDKIISMLTSIGYIEKIYRN